MIPSTNPHPPHHLQFSRPFRDIFVYIDESARQILNDVIQDEDPPMPTQPGFTDLWEQLTNRAESFCTGAPLEIFPGYDDYAPLYELLLGRILYIFCLPDEDEANQTNRPDLFPA